MAATTVDDVDRAMVLSYSTRIPWDKYVGAPAGAGTALNSQDVALIRRLGALAPAALTEALNAEPNAQLYPQALLKVLMNITDVRIIQYVLTLIVDFLEVDPERRVKLFGKPGSGSDKPYSLPFLQLVGSTGSGARIVSTEANPYVVEQAALAASLLLSVDADDHTALSSMLAWVLTNLVAVSTANPRQVKVTEAACGALQVLLRNDLMRTLFVEERGIEKLVRMTAGGNTQTQYAALFCLWMLSLHKGTAKQMETAGAVPAIARIVRLGQPLKLLRMGLGSLANVARNPDCAAALTDICECHVPELVESLLAAEPRISDPELLDDLTFLSKSLKGHASRNLTSMDRYEREVAARRLEWNALHSSEFWKENAAAFEAREFKLIKGLVALLSDETVDDVTLAVALHDLGEFAVHHPQGKAVLATLGAREACMNLLEEREEEDDVKQQALTAMSKLMVTKWQFTMAAREGKVPSRAA